ncbi:MAG: sigma factor-like helix-turn-helix DNA-binding protein [Solirubrobacteraceae bacterium]
MALGRALRSGRGTVSRYLFTIARNTAVDLHRRRPKGQREELGELVADGDAFDQLVTGLTVRDALESLQPTFREVLELTYDQALSQAQIAEALDRPGRHREVPYPPRNARDARPTHPTRHPCLIDRLIPKGRTASPSTPCCARWRRP